MHFAWQDLIRLLGACLAGAAIGLERELHDKPAGLRTNVMICLGAALFTLLSFHVADFSGHDPGRIAAQVVTGVGFLGAGAVIQSRGSVIGLTTAATIWLNASIGMAFGAGHFGLGIVATALTILGLFGLSIVEEHLANWRTTAKFQIEMEPSTEISRMIKQRVRELGLYRKSWQVSKTPDGFTGFLEIIGPEKQLEEFQKSVMAEPGVKSLERL